jgi:ribosomal protein S14
MKSGVSDRTNIFKRERSYSAMFVHFHNREDHQCDGCGRRTVIVDLLSTHTSRDLRFCKNCFRELAASFRDPAAEFQLDVVGQE